MIASGLASVGSSSAPARTTIRCGRPEDSENIGVPQAGQKLRCIVLPLSAALSNWRVSPCTAKESFLKTAFTEALPHDHF